MKTLLLDLLFELAKEQIHINIDSTLLLKQTKDSFLKLKFKYTERGRHAISTFRRLIILVV